MVVFMDVHRLQSAQDFQVQFSTALRLSRVVVVFLTAAALEGQKGHMETEEDNCLIEWLLALFYKAYGEMVDRHKQTQTQLPFHTDGKQILIYVYIFFMYRINNILILELIFCFYFEAIFIWICFNF